MGETKGQARRIRIDYRVLAAIAMLLLLILAAAVFIVPKFGRTVSEYREKRAEYKAAAAELKAAQAERTELETKLAELKTMSEENQALQAEVFELAAALENDIVAGNTDKKICYITVDDGPYNRGREFLRIFKEYDVKATFFLTTANGNKLPDKGELTAASMYPEYLKYGHTIGNHTYSHNYGEGGVYKSAAAFMKSVKKQQDFTVKATGGYEPKIVRFPGGMSTAGDNLDEIREQLREAGYGWIDWTVDSGDSRGDSVTSQMIKRNVLSVISGKNQKIMVVLFHEWSVRTQEAMPEIIRTLQDEGYIFLPLFYDSIMVNK